MYSALVIENITHLGDFKHFKMPKKVVLINDIKHTGGRSRTLKEGEVLFKSGPICVVSMPKIHDPFKVCVCKLLV